MIDELDRVQQFRANTPPPTAEATEAARAALAGAIARSGRSRARRSRARRSPAVRGWRRGGAFSAVAVAAGVIAALIVSVSGSGSPAAPSTAAAAVFRQLAVIAASGPSLVPGPGHYLYTDSRNDYASVMVLRHGACTTDAVEHRQLWVGANGSGLLRETDGPVRFTSAADRALCQRMAPASQLSSSPSMSNLWFAADCFQLGPTNDMAALSTDPRVLLRQMRRIDGGPPGPGEDFVHVGDFLRETDASPALRAALYRAAALIPGVRLLGRVRDHLGRTGLGVAYDAHGIRHELIFDPRTSALMAEADIGSSAATSDWAVYLASRVVDRVAKRSPVPLTPPCVNSSGYGHQVPGGTAMTGAPLHRAAGAGLPSPRP